MRSVSAAGLSVATAPPLAEQAINLLAGETIEQQKQLLIEHLQQRYSKKDGPKIRIDVRAPDLQTREENFKGGDVMVTHINSAMAELVTLQNLSHVLSQYPPEVIQQNVHRIGVGAGLTQEWLFPLPIGGIAERHKRNGGHQLITTIHSLAMTAQVPTNILRPYFVALGKTLRESTTHHEIGHLLLMNDADDYRDWIALNPPGFTYPAPGLDDLNSKPLGFARGYGQMSHHEDMATVFEAMMVDYKDLLRRVESTNDEVLGNKIKYVKNKLKNMDRRFTDGYWEDLSNKRISEKYWKPAV